MIGRHRGLRDESRRHMPITLWLSIMQVSRRSGTRLMMSRRAISRGSLSRSSLAAPCSAPALLLGAATSGRRVCKTFVRRTLPTSRDLLGSRRKTLKPLSSPALQNQLQVFAGFAGPVRQNQDSLLDLVTKVGTRTALRYGEKRLTLLSRCCCRWPELVGGASGSCAPPPS